MVLGQTLVAGSVVQGAKLRVWVKPRLARVWSRERNCGFGSSAAPPECGPGREIMVLGQALVAGSVVQGAKPCPRVKPRLAEVWSREPNCGPGQARPRPRVVRGEKLWSWVKHWWREAWSREQNCGPGSNPPLPECGPGRETAAPGQARPCPRVVRGEKLRSWVKPRPARVWSREPNRAPGSSQTLPEHGPRT